MMKLIALTATTIALLLPMEAFAKKGGKGKNSSSTQVTVAPPVSQVPKPPATVHTGVFFVEAGGVLYQCHNYCAGLVVK